MFHFKNKSIIILSPQSWGEIHISKHHYAIELAKKHNIVYFFNPPARRKFPSIIFEKEQAQENLYIITYSYFFPYIFRFHFRKIFNLLQKIHLNIILRRIHKKIDIVWCFDTNLFSDLNIFKADIKIYHPVDNISGNNQKKLLQTSDFIFTVSDVIISELKKIDERKKIYFINHGLSEYFLKINHKRKFINKKINAYFVGNLLLSAFDRDNTKKIIKQNPDVHFVFIGPYSYDNNIAGFPEKDADEFIKFLKKSNNVSLKGKMHPKIVAKEIVEADVFLVLIDCKKDVNKCSNSHKILEYMSVGKLVVSNRISIYADKRDLIIMPKDMDDAQLPSLFKKAINNLDHYNSPELQQKRIKFALDNTYEKQIERIEKIIAKQINE